MMLDKSFRYAVSNWVIKTEEEKEPRRINQKEIENILNIVLNYIESPNVDLNIPDWILQKSPNEEPKKICIEDIYNLESVVLCEMKKLIVEETKKSIPIGFIKDPLYFSMKHISGI